MWKNMAIEEFYYNFSNNKNYTIIENFIKILVIVLNL